MQKYKKLFKLKCWKTTMDKNSEKRSMLLNLQQFIVKQELLLKNKKIELYLSLALPIVQWDFSRNKIWKRNYANYYSAIDGTILI